MKRPVTADRIELPESCCKVAPHVFPRAVEPNVRPNPSLEL